MLKWLKRLFKSNRIEVKVFLCNRPGNGIGKPIGEPWTVRWPRYLPLPAIGEIVMLPAPPLFISTLNHQIPVVVKERRLFVNQRSADLYVCELFPNENWHDIARRIRYYSYV